MRLTAESVNPMWDGYKIDIVPHLIDPEGKPVRFLERIANTIAEKYSTDISARIQFKGDNAYRYGVHLHNQKVDCEVVVFNQFIEQGIDDYFSGFVERLFYRPIDKAITESK